jgi:glyoxylate reductase
MLKAGRIFSAGFDVYENEPLINTELYSLKNVVLLPHLGSATVDARNAMAELAAKNVISVLGGRGAITPVLI